MAVTVDDSSIMNDKKPCFNSMLTALLHLIRRFVPVKT